jgi:hypothetical protein
MIAATDGLPAANRVITNVFDAPSMDRLVAVADAYGQANIYCTYEFAALMVPETGWISNEQMNTLWNVGYLANYKGHRVIVLPQSFIDNDNAVKVIDPRFAWVIPTGGNDKPVKIAFEGQSIVSEAVNRDQSREIQIYKKVGVGIVLSNNICRYINTALSIQTGSENSTGTY